MRSAVGLRQCRPERPLELAEVAVAALGILPRVEVGGRPLGVRVDSVVAFHSQPGVAEGVRREEDPGSPWVHSARGADGTRASVPQQEAVAEVGCPPAVAGCLPLGVELPAVVLAAAEAPGCRWEEARSPLGAVAVEALVPPARVECTVAV